MGCEAMNPKLAVALLVAIVLLFVVGVSTGAFHSSNSLTSGWVEALKNGVHPDSLTLSEVQASPSSCIQSGKLVIGGGGTCVLQVAAGAVNVRRLRLTIQAGLAAITAVQKPDSSGKPSLVLDDETIPKTHNFASIDIYQQGADITIHCASLQPCQLA
jgi:hypothetical protein